MLQAAFLASLFLPELISDTDKILGLQLPTLPSTESLQYRALWALFALTGLLSSLPVLKEGDAWLRKQFHRAALIPDDARLLAEQLRDANVIPSDPAAAAEATGDLGRRRDVANVARGAAAGALESTLFKTLWLKYALAQLAQDRRNLGVRMALERDLNDIAGILKDLKPDLESYFDAQDSLLPAGVCDIDEYIRSHIKDVGVANLCEQRSTMARQCSALYYRMCLIMALLVYGAKGTPNEMESALRAAGFQIMVTATPAWDWNTIARVVGTVFLTLLVINIALIGMIVAMDIDNAWSRNLTRTTILFDAVVDTIAFGVVVLTAIRIKRVWRFSDRFPQRSENLFIGLCSFAVAAAYYCMLQYLIGGYVNYKPLLFATAPGIAGYFVGCRSLDAATTTLMASRIHASRATKGWRLRSPCISPASNTTWSRRFIR